MRSFLLIKHVGSTFGKVVGQRATDDSGIRDTLKRRVEDYDSKLSEGTKLNKETEFYKQKSFEFSY